MDFGEMLKGLKLGNYLARRGWNGKGMYLFLVELYTMPAGCELLPGEPEEGFELAPFIAMKTADGKVVPWLASQTDVLAEDWELFGG